MAGAAMSVFRGCSGAGIVAAGKELLSDSQSSYVMATDKLDDVRSDEWAVMGEYHELADLLVEIQAAQYIVYPSFAAGVEWEEG
ncbi:hypothetical protein IMCC26134_02985 [Verrucomicrobia bacterium IMCC26134]|jgi:hypothetical protein|nr:hypothetical protein IMCC26134_02985 [Verrucomicrobia bacterium IMCC26134]